MGLNFQFLNLRQQISRSLPLIFLMIAVSGVISLGIYTVGQSTDILLEDLTRDPAATPGIRIYFGFLSNLGIWAWMAAASICLFSAVVIRQVQDAPREYFPYLFTAGMLSFGLGIDDALLMHEHVLPKFLGVSEKLIYFTYGGLVLLYGLAFYKLILFDTDYLFLVTAGILFGVSILMDQLLPSEDLTGFMEDVSKLIGIIFWLVYFARASRDLILKAACIQK